MNSRSIPPTSPRSWRMRIPSRPRPPFCPPPRAKAPTSTLSRTAPPSGVFVPNDGPHVYIDQLNVHADVYDPGKRADYRRTIAAEAVAKARKDIAERGLVATVSEDFYSMVAAQRKIVNAQASLKEARDFQDLSEKQERGGEVAVVDVVKARLQVRQRERELQDAQANLDKARMGFAVILFPTYNQEFGVTDDLETAPKLPEKPEVQSMAGKNSPDIRAAEATVQQSTFGMQSARAAYLPTLTVDYWFGIQANYFAIHDPRGNNQLGSSVAAQLNIPIWNWGATKSKVRQAEIEVATGEERSQRHPAHPALAARYLLHRGPGRLRANRVPARFRRPVIAESPLDASALHCR